jgi:hypothetical protein
MKKLLVLLVVVLLLGFQALGQKRVLHYGVLDYSGIQKVVPRAMFKQRPWIKDFVENGVLAPGCEILTLEEDCFILFASNENNSLDRNYLVVPEGDTILIKGDERFYPKCGNKIVSMRKVSEYNQMAPDTVDNVVVLTDTVYIESQRMTEIIEDEIETKPCFDLDQLNKDNPKTWLQKNGKWVYPVTGLLVSTGVGFIAHGDGIWYGLGGGGNVVPPEEEFHPVDANPQAGLIKPKGITLGFHF